MREFDHEEPDSYSVARGAIRRIRTGLTHQRMVFPAKRQASMTAPPKLLPFSNLHPLFRGTGNDLHRRAADIVVVLRESE